MMTPTLHEGGEMKYLMILIILLVLPNVTYAEDAKPMTDPTRLNEQDIGNLTSGLSGLFAKCPGLKGKKSMLVKLSNKTDEQLDDKVVLASLQAGLKKVSRITLVTEKKSSSDGLTLNLELTARKVLSGNTHTGRYLLKGSIEKDEFETCTIESKHEKVGDIEPKKAPGDPGAF